MAGTSPNGSRRIGPGIIVPLVVDEPARRPDRGGVRVAIVYPRANLESVLSLIGATEELAARGFEVEVLTYSTAGQPAAVFNSPRVRVCLLGVVGLVVYSHALLRGLC